MAPQGVKEGIGGNIGDAKFFARLSDDLRQGRVVMIMHRGEEMVFYLQVQSTGKMESQETVRGIVVRAQDLVNAPILVVLSASLAVQVGSLLICVFWVVPILVLKCMQDAFLHLHSRVSHFN